ncbi:MAG: dihydrofolate reductase [Desulfobacterales bacterium]|nr:MAG: dihydrofolate reductase [Desulfobacterales bacterium]
MRISLIVAMAANRVIGHKGRIPWQIPGEQRMFKEITIGHTVIMGRKTYESLGRPLPERVNIVITRQKDFQAPGCIVARDLPTALANCPPQETEAFIAGGSQLYHEALPLADRVYLTVIPREFPGDTFFPEIPPREFQVAKKEHVDGIVPYDFYVYERIRGEFG